MLKKGATGGALAGADNLLVWQESRSTTAGVAAGANWTGAALVRTSVPTAAGGSQITLPTIGTGIQIAQVDRRHVLQMLAAANVLNGRSFVRPLLGFGLGAAALVSDFAEHWDASIAQAAFGVATTPAISLAAWIRKINAGDVTSCRMFLGFLENIETANFLGTSQRTPRLGLMGDGAQGFRFGSLHCPASVVDGGVIQDADALIDVGSDFQPTELVAPGVLWFHVRVKCVPGIPGQPARYGCYLNGRLVQTVTAIARFPAQPTSSGGLVSANAYETLSAAVGVWPTNGGASGTGFYMRDLVCRIEDNWNL